MRVGLMLSGGFGKGAYQVGALKAIQSKIDFQNISCISAASIGCLNAYAYAADCAEYADDAWNSINKSSEKTFLTELYKSGYLDKVAEKLGKMPCLKDFYLSVLKLELRNRTVDYINMRHLTDANLRKDYLRASIAVPFLSKSVKINGSKYFDGGCVDNNPMEPLLKEDLDIIIALCFDRTIQTKEDIKNKNIIYICFDDGTRMKKEMFFTKRSIRAMMCYGEKYTKAVLDFIFYQNEFDLPQIQKRIEEFNMLQSQKKNKKRITIAHSLTKLNKLTKKLCKAKIHN